MKEKSISYILWCLGLIGFCGIHRLYLGKIVSGIVYLFTLGLFGIGQFIDLFLIPKMVDEANNAVPRQSVNQNTNIQQQQVIVNISKDMFKDEDKND